MYPILTQAIATVPAQAAKQPTSGSQGVSTETPQNLDSETSFASAFEGTAEKPTQETIVLTDGGEVPVATDDEAITDVDPSAEPSSKDNDTKKFTAAVADQKPASGPHKTDIALGASFEENERQPIPYQGQEAATPTRMQIQPGDMPSQSKSIPLPMRSDLTTGVPAIATAATTTQANKAAATQILTPSTETASIPQGLDPAKRPIPVQPEQPTQAVIKTPPASDQQLKPAMPTPPKTTTGLPTHTTEAGLITSPQTSALGPNQKDLASAAATLTQQTHAPLPKRIETKVERAKLDVTAIPKPVQFKAPAIVQWNVVQSAPVQPSAENLKSAPVSGPDPLAATRGDTVTTTTQSNSIPLRMELPQHIARQIAEALQNMPNRPVEIRLNPDELGRVRLGVSTSEGNIVVNVVAERPETSDLLRRHISALETAFQELGYTDISFAFNGEDSTQTGNGDTSQNDTPSLFASDDTTPSAVHLHLSSAPATGIDIRL